jgi:phage FluMu gp28-like protein
MTGTAKVIEYQRPKLAQYQLDAIFCDERYSLIEASTKAGKTVGCLAWIIEQTLPLKANQNTWWVAPVYEQAKIAYRRLKNNLTQGIFRTNEQDLSLTFANGARIVCKSAEKPDNLYGEDVFAAVADEASRMREEAWFALRSTLTATKGPIRIIGNVKGRKNWFFKLARRAEAGEPNMHYAKITAHDAIAAGVLDLEEIEDARRTLPKEVFDELYLAIPTEDGSNPFGIRHIQKCYRALSALKPVKFGVDLAKSVDWTVIIGLDHNNHACVFERFQKPWRDTIWSIQAIVGKVPCLVDSTGVGDPILEELQKEGKNYEGFKFTSQSKQQIMEGLAVAIQQNAIGYPEGVISNELESFEYEHTRTGVRYNAAEGMHDDCVCSLALAHSFKPRVPGTLYGF